MHLLIETRAQGYRDDFYTFMENFTEFGFRRDDPTTWTQDHLPILHKGGLINHSVGHERFMWQIRCEPGVIEPFAKIWQDDCLLVSFDGGNLALPGKMQDFKAEKWAHGVSDLSWFLRVGSSLATAVDQSVSKLGIRNIQGIVNLAPNGPEDGGLLVLPGSHQLYDGFFSDDWYKTADEAYRPGGARHKEDSVKDAYTCSSTILLMLFGQYHFKPHEYAWFEGKCPDWVKVCAEPGDLILWESRTMHYNCPPSSASDRCAVYVSYEPAAMADEHNKQLKRKGFDERFTSTHWA